MGTPQQGSAELLQQSTRTHPQTLNYTGIKSGCSYFFFSDLPVPGLVGERLLGREEPCEGGEKLWAEALAKAALIWRHQIPRPSKAWQG